MNAARAMSARSRSDIGQAVGQTLMTGALAVPRRGNIAAAQSRLAGFNHHADGLGAAVMAASLNAGRHDAGGDGRAAGVGLCVELHAGALCVGRYGRTAVIPFITLPADTLPISSSPETLLKGLEFHVSIVDGSDIGRKMSSGVGELQLDNSDRSLRHSIRRTTRFDGRRVYSNTGRSRSRRFRHRSIPIRLCSMVSSRMVS
jgi:hypothetical protein